MSKLHLKLALIALGLLSVLSAVVLMAKPQPLPTDQPLSTISGKVVGKDGPEAGVWVIAETDDLKTGYTKIVVTDEKGRFVLPDMPEANYEVWVRGYGLKDSPKTHSKPGETLSLNVRYPDSAQGAAQIYPASYWHSLAQPPGVDEFPGTGKDGNGIATRMTSQEAWVDSMKQHCQLCHQMGTPLTRELTHWKGAFKNAKDAWQVRLSLPPMQHHAQLMGHDRVLAMYADWTDRIAAGEVPPQPPRPEGIERNLVITLWDWGNSTTQMVHDVIVTDKRNAQVNANGPYYGVAQLNGELLITDPKTHTSTALTVPMRDSAAVDSRSGIPAHRPDQANDAEVGFANNHNHMLDEQERVWMTSSIRRQSANPIWCQEGSEHPSANYFPLSNSNRQASYYDPATASFTLVDTCYVTHHLQFANDDDDTLWFSGDQQVVGWLNTRKLDKTGDEQIAQGWCPTVLDTNGDGKITRPWNEPGEAINPQRDTRIDAKHRLGDDVVNEFIANFYYGIIPNPVDGSIWVARPGPTPGALVRLELGKNPPETCKAEVYEPPFNNGITPRKDWGYAPRGVDVTTDGIIWTALSGSSHLASFDRRKCKVTNGPTATGQHCPEGWKLYPAPGPKIKGVDASGSGDFHYYNYVDQFNALGLGKNTPIANGTGSDALLALNPKTKQWLTLRVPYPMGFYTRGLDGRIDNPEAGWKGAAIYANYGGWPAKHIENGENANLKVVKFQLRPNPLAE